ncbi:MAG: ABC transporter ATP-binding protein [Coriobacteriia bacterium]|nr:ABC transporter ATP-binding protein [Coriobacteriia bacterium]
MSTNDVAIRVEGACKTYKRIGRSHAHMAVDGVSLKVERGTIHGLLGPNGAGKTTTLKMLIGLVRPTAGTFEMLGEDSTSPKGRRSLGFLPEQPYFPQHLTALQALRFYGRLGGVLKDEIDGRSNEVLAKVGLRGEECTELSKFSRGMLQRLGIAQAIIGRPEIVVLDEPASGLDPVGQRDVRSLMLELRERGTTVLLSSHQLSEVEAVCDRVTILNFGKVAAEGHIDELLNVSGQTSFKVRGLPEFPRAVSELASDVAVSGSVWVFSVEDSAVRAVVDAIDDAGGTVMSVTPKRESLEDYFARLITLAGLEVAS